MRNQLLGQRYRILDLIGEGGMAYVYRAVDEKLGRQVAVKLLHEHMERNPDIRARFQQEAKAVSALDHANIVKIYDFSGDHSDRLWIVTEVIRGKNLAQYLQRNTGGWLSPIVAACIVREVCRALEAAHDHGIVHRDVKPENVMLSDEGRIKLMDFGIAKDLGNTRLTMTGTFMGSPSYMSPEQVRGRDVDLRSDLYSLSVMFYEIVTGRLPFVGPTTHDVVMQIVDGGFTHPCYLVPTLDKRLNELIIKGMAKVPSQRLQSAKSYGAELDVILAELGFDESYVELERFAKDPEAFDQRATQWSGGAPTVATPTRGPTLAQRLKQPKVLAPAPSPGSAGDAGGDQTPTIKLPPAPTTGRGMPVPKSRPQPAPPLSALAPKAAAKAPSPGRPLDVRGRQAAAPKARIQKARGSGSHGAGRRGATRWPPIFMSVAFAALVATVGVYAFANLSERAVRYGRNAVQAAGVSQSARPSRHQPGSLASGGRKQPTRRNGTPTVLLPESHPQEVERVGNGAASVRVPLAPLPSTGTAAAARPTAIKAPDRLGSPKAAGLTATSARKPKRTPELAHGSGRPDSAKDGSDLEVTPLSSDTPPSPNIKVEGAELRPARRPAQPPQQPTPNPPTIGSEGSDAPLAKSRPVAESGSRTTRSERPHGSEGAAARLQVSSHPAAEIYVDGRRLGTTLDNTSDSGWLHLPAGSHLVELRRQGYAPRRLHVDLQPDERRTVARQVLEPLGAAIPGQRSDATQLTIRISAPPAQVVVRGGEPVTTRSFTMTQAARTLTLPPGRYSIHIERGGEVKERELMLTGQPPQLTFSAEFKGGADE